MRTKIRTNFQLAISCAFGACLLGAAIGCGGRDDDIEQPLTLQPPLALSGHLVFIDHDGDRAFLLDLAAKQLKADTRIVTLPHDPVLAVRRNGENEALIVALGRRASEDEDVEPASLAVLGSKGQLRKYELGNPFDRLAQSDDGRYVFLFKSTTAKRLIDSPNEIAIVDLDKMPKDEGAVSLRTLEGESPLSVVFSPQMSIVGEDRRLAIVLSHKNVTLIDLNHLERNETTVQLSGMSGGAVEPTQIAFNPSAPELYVRGAGSSDIFVFNLSERPGGTEDEDGVVHNDFRPFINQLGVGGQPSDVTLYEGDAKTRLLVLTASNRQASIVDSSTSGVTNVTLPSPANHSLLFVAASPRDREPSTRALLYNDNASTLLFLDLADIEERGSRNIEQLDLGKPIAKLIALPDEQRVLVLHPGTGVSLVDLAARTLTPLSSATELVDASFDPDQRRLWIGPSGQPRVAWLDLESGDTHELLLDANVDTLVPMFDSNQVAIVHDDTDGLGYVTVLDATDPKRQTAKSVRGFAIADLLDRGR